MSTGEMEKPRERAMSQRDEDYRERVIRIEGRLESGQKEFSGMREHIRRVEKQLEEVREAAMPKPLGRMQLIAFILGPVIGVSIMLGGYVWQMAKYPDRDEFNRVMRDSVNTQTAQAARVQMIEHQQTVQAVSTKAIESTVDRLEASINRLADKLEKKK